MFSLPMYKKNLLINLWPGKNIFPDFGLKFLQHMLLHYYIFYANVFWLQMTET